MKTAYLVAGLAFGDEGKGATTDFLVRKHHAGLVVRYNGGAQAAHNVVCGDGRSHTFAQFGSGTFVPGVRTFLSKYMVLQPLAMLNEELELQKQGVYDAFQRTSVDRDALVITPFQREVNWALEASRGAGRHGSCGMGVGQTRSDFLDHGDKVLFVKDLLDPGITLEKLKFIKSISKEAVLKLSGSFQGYPWLESESAEEQLLDRYQPWLEKVTVSTFEEAITGVDVAVFEGAQGLMLDEVYGTFPHNTWTDTTFTNALSLLQGVGFTGEIVRVGCFRTYYTRHGAGPFRTEVPTMYLPESNNTDGKYQGHFRFGLFDIPAALYALDMIGGVDYLALGHLDHLALMRAPIMVCVSYYPTVEYDRAPQDPWKFVEFIEQHLKTRVAIMASGPTAGDRIYRYGLSTERAGNTRVGVSCGSPR